MDIKDLDISPELREKAKSCKTADEILELAKEEGYELTDAQVEDISGGQDWNQCPFDMCGPDGIQ